MSRRLVIGLSLVAGFLVVVGILVVVSIPPGSVTTTEEGSHVLEIAMLQMPVADPEPVMEAPDQFLGVPHREPRFDTSRLGPDLTLRQEPRDLLPLDSAPPLCVSNPGFHTSPSDACGPENEYPAVVMVEPRVPSPSDVCGPENQYPAMVDTLQPAIA